MSTDELIAAVFERRYIWDRSDGMYRDRDYVEGAWSSIALELGISKDAAKAKWKGLRDTFRRELAKKSKRRSNGGQSSSHRKSSWQHYKSMLFLKDQIIHRSRSVRASEESPSEAKVDRGGAVKTKCEYVVVLEGEPSQEDASKRLWEESKAQRNLRCEEQAGRPDTISSTKEAPAVAEDDNADSDLYFFKSLIPYLKGLAPLEKLLLRTQIQDLVFQRVRDSVQTHAYGMPNGNAV